MAKLFLALVFLSALCGLQTTHAAGRGLLQAAPNGTIASVVPVRSDVRGYLLVTDGEVNGQVTVIDLRTGEINETLQLANSSVSVYSSSMGRYAYILQRTANVTRIYDSQMYLDFHEDHFDLEQDAAPGLMTRTIPGAAPTHFVQRGRNAAIFHDQSGEVTLLNELSVANSSYTTTSFKVDPHHGAAVPLRGNFYVVSHANQTAVAARVSSSPAGVLVHNANGSLAYDGAQTACPRLHGSATNGYHALFGCTDGILVVTYTAPANLTHKKIPYPVAGVYTGTIYGHPMYKTFFGLTTAAGASVGVHALDPVKMTATLVVNATADGNIVSTAYDPAGAFFAVLSAGNDGTLTLLNPQTGAVLRRATGVLGAAAPASEGDDHSTVLPVVQAGLGRIFISNPEKGVVNEHNADNFELLRAFNLGGHPYRMAILGPTQYWDYVFQH